MAKTTIGRDLGETGPRADSHERAAQLQREATAALDSVHEGKRRASVLDPQRDTFAANRDALKKS